MAESFSFDVVSDFDRQELVNTLDQVKREISQPPQVDRTWYKHHSQYFSNIFHMTPTCKNREQGL